MKTQNVHEIKMLEAWDKARELRFQRRMGTLNAFVCKMWVVVWLGGCAVLMVLVFKQMFN
jgi:hypothetical protein